MAGIKRENLVLLVFAVLCVGGLGAFGWSVYANDPLPPKLGQITGFELEDTRGGSFKSASLLGKVWITDFFFTTCAGICVDMTAGMKTLQDRLDDVEDVRLVSISVDPLYDTAEALNAHATQHGAIRDRWYFLRGEVGQVHAIEVDQFKLGGTTVPMNHSNKFVLIDRQGGVRGYYDGAGEDKEQELRRLERDARTLIKSGE